MEKSGSAAVAAPLLTLIVMSEYSPSSALVGVPLSSPVAMLKLPQEGLCAMEKLSVLPAGPLAVGLNAYACPATTDVGGVPVIVGAFAAATTGNAALTDMKINNFARRTIPFGCPMMCMRSPRVSALICNAVDACLEIDAYAPICDGSLHARDAS
jgi:hypothetical protein